MSIGTKTKIGWGISILVGLLIGFSAFLKITQNEMAVAQAASMGIPASTYQVIGIVELAALILMLIPRTGLLGFLFLIAYMGGAIATHVQHQQPIGMAVGVQIWIWIALALRYPETLKTLTK